MKQYKLETESELEIYLNSDLETKYNYAKANYYKLHPSGNLDEFHFIEIDFLEDEIQKHKMAAKVEPMERRIHYAQVQMLAYIKELNEAPQQAEQPYFKNSFDSTPAIEVYRYFKEGLFDKGFLTEIELAAYLKAAFEMKTAPEVRFKLKNIRTKKNIEAVFYNYYKNVAGKIHGTQKKYAALLGDYFEGYKTDTVSTNFAKSNY